MVNRFVPVGPGLVAATILSITMSNAAEEPTSPGTLARAIQVEVPEVGSVEDALHIRRASGRVELKAKVSTAKLTIDLYRDGKKVDSHTHGAEVPPKQAVGEVRFSVQVIDLDYLPLGGGKRGHIRLLRTLKLGDLNVSSTSSDVSKDICGGGLNSLGFQRFRPHSGSATEVPLFHMIMDNRPDEKGRSGQYGGGSVEEVVRMNKSSDVLVATIIVEPSLGE